MADKGEDGRAARRKEESACSKEAEACTKGAHDGTFHAIKVEYSDCLLRLLVVESRIVASGGVPETVEHHRTPRVAQKRGPREPIPAGRNLLE